MLNRTPLFDAHVSAGATMVDFGGWEMPIFAVSLARFGVSFAEEKGDFIGRAPLFAQKESGTERKVVAINLTDRGVIRAGMEVYQGDKHIGWVTSGTMVPYYEFDGDTIATVRTYCYGTGDALVVIPEKDGKTDLDALKEMLTPEVSGVYIQQPNFYGQFEDAETIGQLVHEAGAMYIMGCNPIALAITKTPAACGADIAVGEGQPLGMPLSYGGPYLGFMATTAKHVRKLPGRIVGQTEDNRGNRVFVLSLQARLKGTFDPAFDRLCMHEFVLDLSKYKKETGVSALDVAKTLIDYGMHPPTMYFPLIVHEALMLEPTETESMETLDWAADVLRELYALGFEDPEYMHGSPHNAPIGRPDEVKAARSPILKFEE